MALTESVRNGVDGRMDGQTDGRTSSKWSKTHPGHLQTGFGDDTSHF